MQAQELINQLKLERERITLTLNTLEEMQAKGHLTPSASVTEPSMGTKRTFSAETRKKMSEAKKQYWAFIHAKQKESAQNKSTKNDKDKIKF